MCYAQIAMVVIAVASAAMEAKAQKQAGKANQQIAENNAKLAEAQGKDAAILGARDQQQSAWRTRALIGQQKAAIAASNLDMDIGTPLDILGESALFGGADRSAMASDAARKAWGFQSEALNYRNQGAQAAWQGKTAGNITILKGIGSAIGSFGGGFGGGVGGASSHSVGYASAGYGGMVPGKP